VIVTVAQPKNDMITGGGHLINTSSAGQYAAENGLKTNLGFNLKYNRPMTNLQGNVNIIIRTGDGKAYQIKANAMNSLSTNVNQGTASFMSKANLTDITDPDNPISLGGNLDLQMTMKDSGNPGSLDTIGVTLRSSSGALLFSNHWNGTNTVQQNLSGGNLVVR
jgi:hypothetical protein